MSSVRGTSGTQCRWGLCVHESSGNISGTTLRMPCPHGSCTRGCTLCSRRSTQKCSVEAACRIAVYCDCSTDWSSLPVSTPAGSSVATVVLVRLIIFTTVPQSAYTTLPASMPVIAAMRIIRSVCDIYLFPAAINAYSCYATHAGRPYSVTE